MLVFYGSSTLLRSFRARSVNLSALFPGKPPRQFTSIVSAHSFASNWQLPFLNQRKGDNGRRIFHDHSTSKNVCRTWGWNPRPAAYQADAGPTELPYPSKKFESRRVVHAAERLALPRSMPSVRYSLEAIFKSLRETASRCTESCIIIQQSSWSNWNTI